MCLRAFATSRFARLRPPAKIGNVMRGANVHTLVPPANRLENASLTEPELLVSGIQGKNVAR